MKEDFKGGTQRTWGLKRLRGLLERYGVSREGGEALASDPLTFFRFLMHTVSTKERVPRSKMRLWKSG